MKAIILAGGIGTRLWPLSRTNFPKQFIKLKNMDKSFFQLTFERCLNLTTVETIFIVTTSRYKFLILNQIKEIGYCLNEKQILIEPTGKNTLPAICYGVKEIRKLGEDIIAVFPSDHLINNLQEFTRSINQGKQLTDKYIITYGVKPYKPDTGYGYIKPKASLITGYQVDEFIEKPDLQAALDYINKGYFWNSGIFMFRSDIFMEEVRQCNQEVYEAFEAGDINKVYQMTPSISVDKGIMEKSRRVAVIPLDIKWNDLGSFDNFYEEFIGDGEDNIGFGQEIAIDAQDNLLYADRDKVVALIGVDNLIVIDQENALLICKKNHSHRVREIVKKLSESHDPRADVHLTAYRPWGSYTILAEGASYKIKRITVLPGKKLSDQLHYHRSEHWIVVSGTAGVTVDDREYLLLNGESAFVKAGSRHRLVNPGAISLEVIEIQIGQYLEEDDIVRFEDDFGRC
ncbi:mannose-1-phosphate guanylyltransferase (GDP) [Desulfotomaculum arcticum]|uniref:mannose-1-phosphate guanylyltransferase n=1 Tax=Desulfotruncus arcticus DSM 17038 TaxID=1121424 RepID=A0A1I2VKF8_9FIRM|nr:mannose-1-phosphate guanylyltransferase/mannose-6-phosphate isomerase [Desulfotruncus arcticus]SFG89825.1 mannose-1-phosphate guanylyltransferase (GDP) [Desulfotomaculum arcticum] [Desulfotruncus arcticus DSM 17038]